MQRLTVSEVYCAGAQVSYAHTDFGVVNDFAQEGNHSPERFKNYLVELFTRSLVEQLTGLPYIADSHADQSLRHDMICALTDFTEEYGATDLTRVLPEIFYRTETDGRAYRVNINPIGLDSASDKLLAHIATVLDNEIIKELGIMLQIKGSGSGLTSLRESAATWYAESPRPSGITTFDKNDELVAKTIGLNRASRVPCLAYSIESMKFSNTTLLRADFDRITNNPKDPIVVEVFVSAGGFCIEDLSSWINNRTMSELDFWDYFMGNAAYYFWRDPDFSEILNKYRNGIIQYSIADKTTVIRLLVDKFIEDSASIDAIITFGSNRSRHNTTLFQQQDFDDIQRIPNSKRGNESFIHQIRNLFRLPVPEFRYILANRILEILASGMSRDVFGSEHLRSLANGDLVTLDRLAKQA